MRAREGASGRHTASRGKNAEKKKYGTKKNNLSPIRNIQSAQSSPPKGGPKIVKKTPLV